MNHDVIQKGDKGGDESRCNIMVNNGREMNRNAISKKKLGEER